MQMGALKARPGKFFDLHEAKMHNTAVCCVMWGDINLTNNTWKIFPIQEIFRKARRELLKNGGLRSLFNVVDLTF